MRTGLIIGVIALAMTSCGKTENEFDATGTFEAVETTVPAQANGIIKDFKVEEGQDLKAGQIIGYIDTVQLVLKKEQLEAQMNAVLSKKPNISTETAALQEDLKQAKRERQRLENLVKADAATQKQLDDATTYVDIVQKKIAALQTSLAHSTSSLSGEASGLQAQIEQINDQLEKSEIVNEVNGNVIAKYAEVNEMASNGKPLYKIADLSTITLRVYITGDQFAKVKIGQKVKVFVDADAENYKNYEGTIEWISNKAEFTPKTIQTKEERANLVYAVKIKVKNDGMLKIGMYGEIKL
ncbi:HlyD family efflux transporter periplasmic adaptor subunit [Flavobacterium amniphilum]|uniref:HlyD family secretion protein n=1 Tax=Flavobacterium amniphilum TaxID=1834035 RepID=UPI00202A205B|nr:HlyD family efflux transporter periplasmic adaptor subunit [Flavobacterium amniphilum]MCL9805889.1 HlyD family efflux transporter periplasmic adaptor subunit [Flavobacterium amniphilum]